MERVPNAQPAAKMRRMTEQQESPDDMNLVQNNAAVTVISPDSQPRPWMIPRLFPALLKKRGFPYGGSNSLTSKHFLEAGGWPAVLVSTSLLV